MKKFDLSAFSVLAILFSYTAEANTNFYLGGTVGYHLYKETVYMQQAGFIKGAIARFQHYGTSSEANLYLSATADYSNKKYLYKGHITNLFTDARTPYEFNGSQNNIGADAQVGAAFNFREIGDDFWVLFAGAAYKRFEDMNDKYTEYGYRRIRNTVFGTMGTKYIWKLGRHIITPSLKSGTAVFSRNLSKTGEDVIHRQKEASLLELSVSYEYWYFWIEPYFKYQHFGNSEKFIEHITLFNGIQIERPTVEPTNITREFGVNIGVRF